MISRTIRYGAVVLLLPVLILGPAGSVEAQLTLDVKNGVTIGSLSNSEAGLEISPAWSFEGSLGFEVGPSLKLFGGYARTSFGCSGGLCAGVDLKATGNHGIVGVEYSSGGPFVRAGIMYGETGVGDSQTEDLEADLGFGVRVSGGIAWGRSVQLRPSISASLMEAGSEPESATATAFSLELGVLIPLDR